ncbi:hypothetical protein KCV04_g16, partial [Aureobasidium melanogenum]
MGKQLTSSVSMIEEDLRNWSLITSYIIWVTKNGSQSLRSKQKILARPWANRSTKQQSRQILRTHTMNNSLFLGGCRRREQRKAACDPFASGG